MTTTLISDALDLASSGWHVLPLRGKLPYTGHGLTDATGDPAAIAFWWQCWPRANIGAKVPDGLLVLDIDPRNGGTLDSLGELPETLTCWSGRGDGGRHLYFLRPAGPFTSTRLPAGIDLKVNGYCVMPPSVHPDTGQPYRWEHHPVARLPQHLRELIRPAPRALRPVPRGPKGDGHALVEVVARHVDKGVNNALYWAACRAAEDNTLDQVAELLIETAVSVGESEIRARRTVESARKKVGTP